MNCPDSNPPDLSKVAGARGLSLVAAACAVLILIAIFLPRPAVIPPASSGSANAPGSGMVGSTSREHSSRGDRLHPTTAPDPTAEETVAAKLSQFASIRRETVRAMARHFKVEVPAEVERFYDAAEAGRWDEMTDLFQSMKDRKLVEGGPKGLSTLWPAIMETYGVAEAAHHWPAQNFWTTASPCSARCGPTWFMWAAPTRAVLFRRCSTKPAKASATSWSHKMLSPTAPISTTSAFSTATGWIRPRRKTRNVRSRTISRTPKSASNTINSFPTNRNRSVPARTSNLRKAASRFPDRSRSWQSTKSCCKP